MTNLETADLLAEYDAWKLAMQVTPLLTPERFLEHRSMTAALENLGQVTAAVTKSITRLVNILENDKNLDDQERVEIAGTLAELRAIEGAI